MRYLILLILLCIAGCTEGYEYEPAFTRMELREIMAGPCH